MDKEVEHSKLKPSVFLFSILGMGAGSFELGKFARKVENWEMFMCMKNAIPFSKHS